MLFGPPHISTYSACCQGDAHQRAGGGTFTTSASSTWSAANMISIIGMRLDYPFMVRAVFALNGATVGTDSWAVGVYSEDAQAKLVASANTLQAGAANALQTVATTETYLAPGRYWLAMGCSGTTATFFQIASSSARSVAGEFFEQLSGYSSGLPATLTPVRQTLNKTFVYGISQGSVV